MTGRAVLLRLSPDLGQEPLHQHLHVARALLQRLSRGQDLACGGSGFFRRCFDLADIARQQIRAGRKTSRIFDDFTRRHFLAGLEVRAFVPGKCVPEDSVTGSLNAGLAQWLIGAGLAPDTYVVRQGTVLGRAGRIEICRRGGRSVVRLRGHARFWADAFIPRRQF